jgi:hypothetical protein
MTRTYSQKGDPVKLFGKVNRGLSDLGRWFRCNRLTLNLKKTEYVYFSRTRPPEIPLGGLEFEGEQISRVKGTRFLRIWVDTGLNWRGHIGQWGPRRGSFWGYWVGSGLI